MGMVLDMNGRIVGPFTPRRRYWPGKHKKWEPTLRLNVGRYERSRARRSRVHKAFFPGLYDDDFAIYARAFGAKLFFPHTRNG